MNITGRLENWHIEAWGECHVVVGDIYDDIHGRFWDGSSIHTSAVETTDIQEGDVVNTRNSRYLLGVQNGNM